MTTDELVEKALEIFNGGLVNYNDAANPRGYTTVYRPKAAMLAALTAIQSDLRARHYGECMAFLREGGWVTAADDLADFLAISRGDLTPMEE